MKPHQKLYNAVTQHMYVVHCKCRYELTECGTGRGTVARGPWHPPPKSLIGSAAKGPTAYLMRVGLSALMYRAGRGCTRAPRRLIVSHSNRA